jgi:hypothetical protein
LRLDEMKFVHRWMVRRMLRLSGTLCLVMFAAQPHTAQAHDCNGACALFVCRQ